MPPTASDAARTSRPRRLAALGRLLLAALLLTTLLPTGAAIASPSNDGDFVDTAGTGYAEAVSALADQGIVRGCAPEQFCPERELTRGQLASVLAEALDLPPTEFVHFTDLEGSVHARGINALAEAGVTRGCGGGAFCPDEPVSRAELATLLARGFALAEAPERFFADTRGVHAPAIDRLAAVGIAAGCGDPLTSFCPEQPVLRWQAALFVGRALQLVPRVEVTTLAERAEQQAAIEAEEQRRREEEQRRREEEEQRRREEQERERARAEREALWDRVAQCESGGNWSINTGNGFYGGLQFALSSWRWVGGSGYPHRASKAEQIRRAEILLARQGWRAWPSCSRQLGLR